VANANTNDSQLSPTPLITPLISVVPLNLFRLGKKNDTTMDKIRDRDVKISQFWRTPNFPDSEVETGRAGEVHWIRGGKDGGISLFDDIETAPISGKFWWCIDEGKKIPSAIAIWGDELRKEGAPKPKKAVHYTVYPIVEMPMDTFKLYLRAFAVPMYEMFKVETETK